MWFPSACGSTSSTVFFSKKGPNRVTIIAPVGAVSTIASTAMVKTYNRVIQRYTQLIYLQYRYHLNKHLTHQKWYLNNINTQSFLRAHSLQNKYYTPNTSLLTCLPSCSATGPSFLAIAISKANEPMAAWRKMIHYFSGNVRMMLTHNGK